MKALVPFVFMLANLSLLFGQGVVESLPLPEESEIIIAELDSLYPSAMHVDPEMAVFNGREKEFFEAYKELLTDLNKHFAENGLKFEKPTSCFSRIYISTEGEIDYYLYKLYEGMLTEDQEKLFDTLLKDFVVDYKISIQSLSPYAQCAPVVFN